MSVAHRLGKTEDEIGSWPLQRLERWMAYFKIVREEEIKAIEKARRDAALRSGKGNFY